ncbi:hypothetical protein J4476_01775 [Candidatus Woesearchaeota archaeon]|nr:hypothetical protein [Candidatus Woesearchaeota archaeon]HIH25886.1 hypothetical protein [Nanoarchaeota archaeon]
MKKYLDTRRYGTKEQEAYTSDVNQLRVEYGDGVQPEERIGNDGEGIEVTYYIETSEEKTQEPNELEVKVDDPDNRTSFV